MEKCKTYAECVAELPTRESPLEYSRTEHSVKFKFVTFDGYLKPAIFSNLEELAGLVNSHGVSGKSVQVTHEIREIRYQRHKFLLQK